MNIVKIALIIICLIAIFRPVISDKLKIETSQHCIRCRYSKDCGPMRPCICGFIGPCCCKYFKS